MISRRGILSDLIAAPSIVAINNIMPVKAFELITNPPALELIDLIKAEITEALKHNLIASGSDYSHLIYNRIGDLRKRDPRLLNYIVGFKSVYYTESFKPITTRIDVTATGLETIIYNHI